MHKQETRITPQNSPPKFLAQHLKPYELVREKARGRRVLEIGCGDGYGCAYLAQVAQEIIGIDYCLETILKAEQKYKAGNIAFRCMEATSLDFQDNSFDIICSFQVIEHIPQAQLAQYLREAKRVMKDNGGFYLSTLNLLNAMKPGQAYIKNPAHCGEFTLPELKTLLTGVFPHVQIYGLYLSPKHRFFQLLKKIGILIDGFYNKVTTRDFRIARLKPGQPIDFICFCKKTLDKQGVM
ncbi:MAG: class I SAM-dependent methyltransferase [Candidatus Omnitrophota bacterium]